MLFRLSTIKILFYIVFQFFCLTIVAQSADLVIQKTGPNTKYVGEAMTYTIVITNNGPDAADGATFQDILPEYVGNVTWGSCTASGGAVCPSTSDYTFTTVNIGGVDRIQLDGTIPTFPNDGEITFTLNMNAPTAQYGGSSFSNTATVAPPTGVAEIANATNESTWNVTLLKDIDLTSTTSCTSSSTMTDCTTFPKVLDYTVTWTNNGPSVADDYRLSYQLSRLATNITGTGNVSYNFPFEIQAMSWTVSDPSVTTPTAIFQNGFGSTTNVTVTSSSGGYQQFLSLGTGNTISSWPAGESITLTFSLVINEPTVTGCGENFDVEFRGFSDFTDPLGGSSLNDTNTSNDTSSTICDFGTCTSDLCPDLVSGTSCTSSSDMTDCTTFPKILDYTVTWTNNGPSAADGYMLSYNLSEIATNISGSGNTSYDFPFEIQAMSWTVSDPSVTTPTAIFQNGSGSTNVQVDDGNSFETFLSLGTGNTVTNWPAGESITLTFSLVISEPTITGCGKSFSAQFRGFSNILTPSGQSTTNSATSITTCDFGVCLPGPCPETDLVSTTSCTSEASDCNEFPKTLNYTATWTNNGPSAADGYKLFYSLSEIAANVTGTGNTSYNFPFEIQAMSWTVSDPSVTTPTAVFQNGFGSTTNVTVTPSNGGYQQFLSLGTGNTITDWPAGESITLTFSLVINEPIVTGCGENFDAEFRGRSNTIVPSGTVDVIDTNSLNNLDDTFCSIALDITDLSISKGVSPAIVNVGDNITMEVTFQNSPGSSMNADNVYWLDTIPTSVEVDVASISCVASGGATCPTVTYDPVTRIMRQDFTTIPAGGQVIVTYVTEAVAPYTLTDETSAYAYNECLDCVPETNITTTNYQIQGTGTNSLGNFVWKDNNINGVQDDGTTGVDGIEIKLYDNGNNYLGSKFTDANGAYLFEDLPNGIYYIEVDGIPSECQLTYPDLGGNDETDSDVNKSTGQSGTYTLSGGTNELSVDIGLYTCPVVEINPIADVCADATNMASVTVSTVDLGGSYVYTWDFGAGATPATATGVGPHTITYSTVGTKTVSLSTSSADCPESTHSENFEIFAPTPVDITGTSTASLGVDYTFNATDIVGATYTWDTDGGTGTSTSSSIDISWSTGGTKTISVTLVDANGCSSTDTHEVVMDDCPIAIISTIADQCIGIEEVIMITSDGIEDVDATYSWTFGPDATPSSATGFGPHSVTFSSLGTKNVSLNVSKTGCTSSSASTSFELFDEVVADISGPLDGEDDVAYTFTTPSVAGASYSWSSPGAIGSSTSNTIDITFPVSGTYEICVTVTTDNCDVNDCHTIIISNCAPPTITGDEIGVATQTYTFSVTGSESFVWSAPTGTTSSGSGTSFTTSFLTDGVHRVEVSYTVRGGCGTITAVHEMVIAALPVELLDFTATAQERIVLLEWATASEENNSHFDIERSQDGISFRKIGSVNGRGNSVEIIDYEFVDNSPLIGTNYYRLKQIDFDGGFSYSTVETVRFRAHNKTVVNLFPNPVKKEKVQINIVTKRIEKGTLSIFDINGKKLYTQTLNVTEGENLIDLDVSSLTQGMFIVQYRSESGLITSKKMIKY